MRRLLTLLIGRLAIAAISASAAARPLGPNGQIAFDRSDLETADETTPARRAQVLD